MKIKNLEISAYNDHNFEVAKNNSGDWFRFDLSFDKHAKPRNLSICWNGVGGVQIVGKLQDGIYVVPEHARNLLDDVMEEYKEEIRKVVKDYSNMIKAVHKIGYYGVAIK